MGVLFRGNSSSISLETDDLDELKKRIYTVYGWPNVKVEITNTQFDQTVERAAKYLNTYSPKTDYIFKHVYPNVSDYVLEKDAYVAETVANVTRLTDNSFTILNDRTTDYIVNKTKVSFSNRISLVTSSTYDDTTNLTTVTVKFENTSNIIPTDIYVMSYSNAPELYVHSIQDVCVSTDYLMGLGMPFQNLIGPAMTIGAAYDSSLLTDYVSLFSAYDLAKRMFGTQPYASLIHPNIARLDPIPYIDTIFCFVITVDHDSNLGSLNEYETNWFMRFMEAAVGKVIGETRRKYANVTLPVGTLDNSGGTIYTECADKEKELIEELKNRHKLPSAYIAIG